jgi:hypothetical protein
MLLPDGGRFLTTRAALRLDISFNAERILQTRLGSGLLEGHSVILQRRSTLNFFCFPLYSANRLVFLFLQPRQLFLTFLICLISHGCTITDSGPDGNP